METKKELRIKHKNLRAQMTKEECMEQSNQIVQHLLALEVYQKAQVIYGYYPLGNEVSLLTLFQKILAEQKKVLSLPRVNGDTMEFYQITDLSQVQEGCFHVMEPVTNHKMVEEEALVLTPGVAFDYAGNRIGYGKGYYDRYFTRYPRLTRIGIAYENQMESQIESEECDKSMHGVITERGWIKR